MRALHWTERMYGGGGHEAPGDMGRIFLYRRRLAGEKIDLYVNAGNNTGWKLLGSYDHSDQAREAAEHYEQHGRLP